MFQQKGRRRHFSFFSTELNVLSTEVCLILCKNLRGRTCEFSCIQITYTWLKTGLISYKAKNWFSVDVEDLFLPKTNSLSWKINGWKMKFLLGPGPFPFAGVFWLEFLEGNGHLDVPGS